MPSAGSDALAVLLLADIAPGHLLWGWSRLIKGAHALRSIPGLRFVKIMGSGFDGGFGLRPSKSRQGVFAVFGNAAAAADFLDKSAVVAAYRAHSAELLMATLRPWSCRGSWDGYTIGPGGKQSTTGPIAALTRASISLLKAPAFWRNAPAAQNAIEAAPGCQLAVGLGEAPLLRQATFSVWDSVATMDAYARTGAHLTAIQAAQRHRYFSESMFVRFELLSLRGSWKGRTYPLDTMAADGAL